MILVPLGTRSSRGTREFGETPADVCADRQAVSPADVRLSSGFAEPRRGDMDWKVHR
jgi:hypothetical protein